MKFYQIKKRKVLKTWQHKDRSNGLASYIYCNPRGYYYFVITCFEKRCGFEECIQGDCDLYVYYNSLDDVFIYDTFDECVNAVEEWHRVWR